MMQHSSSSYAKMKIINLNLCERWNYFGKKSSELYQSFWGDAILKMIQRGTENKGKIENSNMIFPAQLHQQLY